MTNGARGSFGAAFREMQQGNEKLRKQYYVRLEYMSLKEIKTYQETISAISAEIKTARALLDKFSSKALTPEEEKEYQTLTGPVIKESQ